MLHLIGPSQDPRSSRLRNKKKGAAPSPLAPRGPPHTKGQATKTFSGMAGVGVGFHPEHGGPEKGWGGFRASGQRRHAVQSPSGVRGRWQEPLALEGGGPVSELSPTPPRAGRWATPLTCQFKYLFFELTLFKHCSEAFTSFNLKGKNIKWSEYRPCTRTAQLDNEHSAKNTSVPGWPECFCSFRDHYQLKIHPKFHLAGQNSGCRHLYRCETKATLAFPGRVTVAAEPWGPWGALTQHVRDSL